MHLFALIKSNINRDVVKFLKFPVDSVTQLDFINFALAIFSLNLIFVTTHQVVKNCQHTYTWETLSVKHIIVWKVSDILL